MNYVRKVSFHTLGCKLNFSETSTLARHFAESGFRRAASSAEADICVVNTCSVTAASDKKCRNLIRRIHRDNPSAIIAVTGCYAQLRADELAAIEGVDIVLGNNEKGDLVQRVMALAQACVAEAAGKRVATGPAGKIASRAGLTDLAQARVVEAAGKVVALAEKGKAEVHCSPEGELTRFFAAFSGGDRTRAFLKVQDGCDYRCSYCTIPMARGASRNASIDEALSQAKLIAAAGQREIVITGINTGDFGRTTGETFSDLLRALEGVEGIDRYRISSIEPNLLSDEIIGFTTRSTKFMPHFHVPLQSGADRILALMRRRYTTAAFASRIAAARRAMPDAFIGIDVIVGFPGETDEDFDATYAFIEGLAPSFVHIFPYSARPNTPAAAMGGHLAPQIVSGRAAALGELNDRLHRAFCEPFVGRRMEVLMESTRREGRMGGFTPNYLRVEVPYDRALSGSVVEVELITLNEKGVFEGRLTRPL